MNIVLKNIAISLFLVLALMTSQADAYNVSGLVEFSYSNYETKTGDSRSSDQRWTQYYNANLQNYLFDPRAIQYSLGAGYRVEDSAKAQDSESLDYRFSTNLFPGMKYNADFFANKSTTNVQSDSTLSGYDILSTQYGGTLHLNLSRGSRKGKNNNYNDNNNNNNNNNNNFKTSWQLPLPDITLSRTHTESESINPDSPRHETLDSSKALLNFHTLSSMKLDLSAGLEEYRNLEDSSSYDTKEVKLDSTTHVTRDADLRISGSLTDRSTANLSDYDSSSKVTSLNTQLDFKEKNNLRQNYSYSYYDAQSSTVLSHYQIASAAMTYNINKKWSATGGLKYTVAEYMTKATDTTPEEKSRLTTGGADAGIRYMDEYKPDFLGPFVVNTNYAFGYGFSDYVTDISGESSGSGVYYTNNAGISLVSKGWKTDNLTASLQYSNKRDQSALHNDVETSSVSLSYSSKRIARTSILASLAYNDQRASSEIVSLTSVGQTSSTSGHSLLYNLQVDHTVTYYLNLNWGASRQDASTSSEYTISNLTSESNATQKDDLLFAGASLHYRITRNVNYRAELRDEYRKTSTTRTEMRKVDMYLDYRIRQVMVTFEVRWREDLPSGEPRSEQTYEIVKISRPF